jgi:hypothetical protein
MAGVSDTDYAATYNLTALASQGKGLSDKGMFQGDLVTALRELETNWNGILTKLDADGGVNLETYNATYAIDLNDTVVSAGTGISQDNIVSVLDDFVTNFNACLDALDGDTGVADEDYEDLAITDVVNAGTNLTATAVDNKGMSQGALYTLLNTIVTQVNALNAKLDADESE